MASVAIVELMPTVIPAIMSKQPNKIEADEGTSLTTTDERSDDGSSDAEDSASNYSESDDDDDDESESEYSSDDYDSADDEANAALEQELRLNMAHQAQQRAGGVFVSSVLNNLLKKNASDSNLTYLTELALPVHPVMRRGSANDAIGSSNHDSKEEARLAMCIQTSLPTQTFYDKSKAEHPLGNVSPMETLKQIRESLGRSTDPVRNETVRDFFQHDEHHIAAYDLKVMTAVRSNDFVGLQEMYASGKELQCCNRFYESILHTVARRGLDEMLDFLLVKAKLSLRVCCASGRTPLHDACWTNSPNFVSVKRILHECPDFLLIGDNRNYTPLNYVPRDCWGEWNDFLKANPDLVAGCWFI
ncbi:hypothetical protein MPSEU_000912600 [Mayamaea pseudoterrestris]|nr:hypothetical protein MPSEU_000912600 [Mayamaea pseudoterrestris]